MREEKTSMAAGTSVRFALSGDVGAARLAIGVAEKPVNVLSRVVLADLQAALEAAEKAVASGSITSLLLQSDKADTFIAGADVFELGELDPEGLDAYLRLGQELVTRLERLGVPTVALITGAALGGGLEIALACDYRVAVDSDAVKLGLPEVTLGLIPAWGGCVRLPRLIGLDPAARLITAGRLLSPEEARQAGLVDAIAEAADLETVATELASRGKRSSSVSRPDDGSLTRTLAGIRQNIETAAGPYASHYPAPMKALEIVRAGVVNGPDAGFAAERQGLVELRNTTTGQNLLRTFMLKQSAKKAAVRAAGGKAREISHVGIIGGGTMGSGIAHAMLRASLRVTVVEADKERAEKARERVIGLLEGDEAKGRASTADVGAARELLSTADSLQAIEEAELIIEAAFEEMGVKRKLFGELVNVAKPEAILASNTSSLSIRQIAEASGDPSRVVGLHFFNPVPRMPLVEVVRTEVTDADAVATAVAVALSCRKTPVVVRDAPGFVVNRVLMPYLSEAVRAAGEGIDIRQADAVVRDWGLPMGPFELLDTIGLDVVAGIFRSLAPHLEDRVVRPDLLEQAIERGWTGRKSGKGFYEWPADRSGSARPHDAMLTLFGGPGQRSVSAERLVLPMVNESARLIEEGVVESSDVIDLASLLGLGLAPFRGGVARFIDDEGPDEIVRELESLAERYGEHFEPAPLLQRAADEGKPLAGYAGGGR